jgi:hypothetical protein
MTDETKANDAVSSAPVNIPDQSAVEREHVPVKAGESVVVDGVAPEQDHLLPTVAGEYAVDPERQVDGKPIQVTASDMNMNRKTRGEASQVAPSGYGDEVKRPLHEGQFTTDDPTVEAAERPAALQPAPGDPIWPEFLNGKLKRDGEPPEPSVSIDHRTVMDHIKDWVEWRLGYQAEKAGPDYDKQPTAPLPAITHTDESDHAPAGTVYETEDASKFEHHPG